MLVDELFADVVAVADGVDGVVMVLPRLREFLPDLPDCLAVDAACVS